MRQSFFVRSQKRQIEPDDIGTRGSTVPGAVATWRLAERAFRWAPGRYRSRYRTNVVWFNYNFPGRRLRDVGINVMSFVVVERV